MPAATIIRAEPHLLDYQYDDGGRAQAGFKGTTGDCVVRAIAIATGKPYKLVYDLMNFLAKQVGNKRYTSRTGLTRQVYGLWLVKAAGFEWVSCMSIGSGTTVHLRSDQLPSGTLLCKVSKHLVAVIDHTIHDNHDCSRRGTRCVYGYYRKV